MKKAIALILFFAATANANVCDRSQAVRELLEFKFQKTCFEIQISELSIFDSLLIPSNHPVAMKKGDLAGFYNLEYLHIMNVSEFPEGLFDGLPKLKEIIITFPHAQQNSEKLFIGLDNLELLQITDGDFFIPSDLFRNLKNLKSLVLTNIKLGTLDEGFFEGLTNLEILNMERNNLGALPKGIFSKLKNLIGIYLNESKITSLPKDAFMGLEKLERLYIQENNIVSLPADVFAGLVSLRQLEFNYNQITTLPEAVFKDLKNLEDVGLSRNNIAEVPESVFSLANFSSTATVYMVLNPLSEKAKKQLSEQLGIRFQYR